MRTSAVLAGAVVGVAGLTAVALAAAAPTPPAASTEAAAVAPGTAIITPEQFGARGDGVTDDTIALRRALDALPPGGTLELAAGRTYPHSDVLTVSRPAVTITGTGTVLATDESASGFWVMADHVTVDGPTFAMADTSRRWVAFEQMKLRLGPFDGIAVRNVTVAGSAAAGIHVGGATDFELDAVSVEDTRADGIHVTGGARNGTIVDSHVVGSGDDGVAVVSYRNDGEPVRDVTVDSTDVRDQEWGRGFSVVGGQGITYRDIRVDQSAGAGIYVAAESEFDTFGVDDVLVDGATVVAANQQADVDAADRPSPAEGRVVHGAVMVYNSQAAESISDVTMRNLTIRDTHADGYDQVTLNNTSTGTITRQEFAAVAIAGGAPYPFKAVGTPVSAYRTIDWTKDGTEVPDRLGR